MGTVVRFVGVLLGYLVCTALRLTGLRAGLAVMYHRVGEPPGDYAFELVPNLGTRLFESQIRYLRRAFRLVRSEEHTSELQSQSNLVCRLLLEKKKKEHAGLLSQDVDLFRARPEVRPRGLSDRPRADDPLVAPAHAHHLLSGMRAVIRSLHHLA